MALTQDQILQARQKYGIPDQGVGSGSLSATTEPNSAGGGWFSEAQKAWNPAPAPEPEHFKAGGVIGAIQDVAHGAAKRGTESVLGFGHLGQKIQKVVGEGLDSVTGDKYDFSGDADKGIFNPESPEGADMRRSLEPDNFAEKVGGGIEQAVEYGAPSGIATKGEALVTKASEALPGIWGAAARIVGKGAVQGATAGAVDYVDTGGDAKEALHTAEFAGATRGVLATIGEGARALHIPERLYQTIFKNTKKEVVDELKSNALQDIVKKDPEFYKQLVDSGVVKVAKDGAPVVNDTLAEQALDRSLRGSVDTMANQVVKGAYKSELSARAIAANHVGTVDVSHENFVKVLDDVANDYDGVGFNEVSEQAKQLASKIRDGQGQIDAESALELRRFLDRLRLATSFDKPASKLSLTQQNFKSLADSVRAKVNEIPGMKDVMKDYSFYIDALDALAAYAKRTGNNQILGMIDSIFLGAGLSTGSAAPVFMGAVRKMANMPGVATKVGNALENGIMGAGGGTALRAGANAAAETIDQ